MSKEYSSKLEWLQDSFDRKYMKEFFDEFVAAQGLPPNQWHVIQYEHEGHLYELKRVDINYLNLHRNTKNKKF